MTVDQIHLADVWKAYEEQWSTSFSEDVVSRYGNDPLTIHRCRDCELEWFAPALEGDTEFYTQIFSGGIRYEPWRWEFDEAARRIPDGARVAEVGAGEGAFLRTVLQRCESVEAFEKNPVAADALRAAGVKVSESDVREVAAAQPGRADVVCAFQVLEHVADVRGLLSALATVVAPGGEVLLSVPNRERFHAHSGVEPMDCPPHHLSRWSARQFTVAAGLMGLELVSVQFEPPSLSHARALRKRLVKDALSPMTGHRIAQRVASGLARLRMPQRRYERLLHEDRFAARGEYGHTMFAAFRRGAE